MSHSSIFLSFAFLISFALFSVPFVSAQAAHAACAPEQILSAEFCAGDEVSPDETKLLQIINEYRAAQNLAPVPLSKPLSQVANRHLLDIEANLKFITHSWSDCPYDLKDRTTWPCVNDAPKRLKVVYAGQGYENLYRTATGQAAPQPALDAWKKSELHNSLILNLGGWNAKKWDSLGVALRGQYAAIWFGSLDSGAPLAAKPPQGLGVSYRDVVKNLEKLVKIEKSSSLIDKEIWVGRSPDKKLVLELVGTPADIERAGFSIKIRLGAQKKISPENRALLLVFVKNIFPEAAADAEKWLDVNLAALLQNAAAPKILVKDGKTMQIHKDATNAVVLTAKPYKKNSSVVEF